ncbi:MAG: hypothetical protein V1856_03295 [Candidatus Liptonbacteria bacterium]
MRPVYISFLVCFFALAVLGFVGASRAMSFNITCVGDAAHNAACLGDALFGGLGETFRHLSGLKLFSLAITASILFLLFAHRPLTALFPTKVREKLDTRFFAQDIWTLILRPSAARKQSWLSLLEKRDPYNI